MPEEINRVLTDRVSTLLFTHSPEARGNLVAEGIPTERVHYVGNTMIDSLMRALPEARRRAVWSQFGLVPYEYLLVTLHRPSNVDNQGQLSAIVHALTRLSDKGVTVVFPVHPRTQGALDELGTPAASNRRAFVAAMRSDTWTSSRWRPAPARS